jgi:GT2 family glycosyltransferase
MERTNYPDYEIILVGNVRWEENGRNPLIQIVNDKQPVNLPAANNLGAQNANGNILLFLNYDLEPLDSDWLEEMVRWAERPEIGVVGAKLLNPDQSIQHAGLILDRKGNAHYVFYGARERDFGAFGSVDWYRNYSAVSGDCMMMRREVYEAAGSFDDSYAGYSDVDICLRAIQKGYRIVYTPFARLRRATRKTRAPQPPSKPLNAGQLKQLVERGDPGFNPNLSFSHLMPISSHNK